MSNNPVRMLTVQEVAGILHAHPNTVRHWCNEGLLKTHRIGPRGDRRFLPEDVESFLTSYSKDQSGSIEIEGDAVLVVEDDPAFSELMEAVIEGAGYRVVVCETVGAALKEIGEKQFALIFLDLVLPDASGIEGPQPVGRVTSEASVPPGNAVASSDDERSNDADDQPAGGLPAGQVAEQEVDRGVADESEDAGIRTEPRGLLSELWAALAGVVGTRHRPADRDWADVGSDKSKG